jgi:aspartokinase/homoserine dehydrogenase 1
MEKKIPIRIKNTFAPQFSGTVIREKVAHKNSYFIKGISSIERISLLRIQGSGMIGVAGIAARLFGALAKEKINIILITQASSEHSICFAVKPEEARRAKKTIEQEFVLEIHAKLVDEIVIEPDLSIIAIVGENMRKTPGISSKLFQALGNSEVNVVAIAQGSSELNISVVMNQKDETKALNAIHQKFFNL